MNKFALSTDLLIRYMTKALKSSIGKATINDVSLLPEPIKTRIVNQLAPQVEKIRKNIK